MFWVMLTDSALGASHSFCLQPFLPLHTQSHSSVTILQQAVPLFLVVPCLEPLFCWFLSSGNLSFLVFFFFFLSSSPGVSSIASHALTSLAIYSPLLSSLFSFPRGLVQMSHQTEQHDPQRGTEFPLVHQSISNVPGCRVWTLKPSLRT